MAIKLNLYFARLYGLYFFTTFGIIALGGFLITLGEIFDRNFAHLNPSNTELIMLAAYNTPDHLQKIMPLIILLSSMAYILHLARSQQILMAQQTGSLLLHLFVGPILLVLVLGIATVTLLNPLAANLSERFENFINTQADQSKSLLSVADTGIWLRQKIDHTTLIIRAKTFDADRLSFSKVSIFHYEDGVFRKRTEAKKAIIDGQIWRLENVVISNHDSHIEQHSTLDILTDIGAEQILDSFTSIKALSIWKLNDFIATVENAGFNAKEHITQFHRLLSTPVAMLAMFFLAAGICLRAHHRKLPHMLVLSTIGIGFGYFVFLTTFQSLGLFHEWPVVLTIWLPHLLFFTLVFTYTLQRDT